MFGSGLSKIFIYALIIGAGVAYFKYTQDQMAELNREVAKKDFALQADAETMRKQAEALQQQQAILDKLNADFQSSRQQVQDLEDKFHKNGRNLNNYATEKPGEVEKRANAATKRVFKCWEDTVNQGKFNEKDC